MRPDQTGKIDVLDHGFVRLVDSMGSDLSVVRAARVSYDAAWRAGENEGSDKRLINYLVKNRHTTPIEAVEFQFEVKAPIFVLRQWHRHRTWTFNELSARYRELPEEFYIPEPHMVGVQSASNKQMRVLSDLAGVTQADLDFIADLQRHSEEGFALYRKHLGAGVPRELARLFLGLNTYSHQFAKIDLHNLLHFLNLRLHSHAQHEIRVYAEAMLELIRPIAPAVVEAWEATR
ncbi:FAD-dependent thymidylate synthase [Bosea massiliensis]|uniref:Flavin-dependent thymidylate synthase n=1 Tax=Bosea massiliensis TaxID=151419 RepID=A0ABW0PBP9_9HYPH